VRERGDPNEYREQLGDTDNYRCKICSVVCEGKGKIAQVSELQAAGLHSSDFLRFTALRAAAQTQQRLRTLHGNLQQLLKSQETHSNPPQQNPQVQLQLLWKELWTEESAAEPRVSWGDLGGSDNEFD
jgi:hypothetical protein